MIHDKIIRVTIEAEASNTADCLERIALAAAKAKIIVDDWSGESHFGIEIEIAGELARVKAQSMERPDFVEEFLVNISDGGKIASAIESAYGLKRASA